MKKKFVFLSFIAISFCSYFLVACLDNQAIAVAADKEESCETEIPDSDEDILTLLGSRIKIIDSVVYGCVKGKWMRGSSMISNSGKNFEITKTADKCEVTILKTGKKYPMSSQFSSGFEVAEFRDLFKTGWNVTTLLSPKANTIRKYSELHRDLMKGGKFLDNRIDLETKKVRSGKKSLRFYTVDPDASTKDVGKSLIENKNLCFGKGDHIWFSAWFYLEQGVPTTLVDFESGRLLQGPGMRLIIRKNQFATMELKFADKPQYNQFEVPLPRKKWFNIKIHLGLSNHEDGVIEMWQDGKKILSAKGRTLPTHDTIYNMMQVGITAARRETTLLVDDVIVSNKPL